MQLLYFKENTVDILKKQDLTANAKYYYGDNSWIAQKYPNQKLLLPFSKIEVSEFNLKMENGINDDFDNMVIMYENLKFLTDSQASDERLWSGLAHTIFWNYMQHRWPMPNEKDKRNSHILNNYFFWNSTKAVFLNGLSRLWWYARFTYDENLDDHYELTKYVCENDINGKIFPLLSCTFVNNKEVFKNIIKAVKKYEEENNTKLSRDQFGELNKYLNRLSGKVFIDGKDIYKFNDDELAIFRRRQVGLIYQFYNLIPILNVEENITLPLKLDNKNIDKQRLDELIKVLGLEERRTHLPNELSGGQQQRTSIGRAMITNPAIILADEPTGNLDSKASDEIVTLLKKSNKDYKQTIIMITHNLEIAKVADRIIKIEDGKIVEEV